MCYYFLGRKCKQFWKKLLAVVNTDLVWIRWVRRGRERGCFSSFHLLSLFSFALPLYFYSSIILRCKFIDYVCSSVCHQSSWLLKSEPVKIPNYKHLTCIESENFFFRISELLFIRRCCIRFFFTIKYELQYHIF